MEGTQVRPAVRARRGMSVLDRVADGLLGADVPGVPGVWGERGTGGGAASVGVAGRLRDVGAERDRIRAAVRRAHQRRARLRPVLSRRG